MDTLAKRSIAFWLALASFWCATCIADGAGFDPEEIHIHSALPLDEAGFRAVYGHEPTPMQLEALQRAHAEIGRIPDVRIVDYLSDAEISKGPSVLRIFIGHSDDGDIRLTDGQARSLRMLAEACDKSSSSCAFLSCFAAVTLPGRAASCRAIEVSELKRYIREVVQSSERFAHKPVSESLVEIVRTARVKDAMLDAQRALAMDVATSEPFALVNHSMSGARFAQGRPSEPHPIGSLQESRTSAQTVLRIQPLPRELLEDSLRSSIYSLDRRIAQEASSRILTKAVPALSVGTTLYEFISPFYVEGAAEKSAAQVAAEQAIKGE